ncbi:LacI family DNA-binding transcriptional regulator [Desemzia sp. RIT804]|uniref:LacI family DNA-binding transcriptional regulator n=1 Tax=Desemzia sp. RIT 804 TaxID=2810209 RepID=UPI00194EFD7E|nr:LacI family DNA-binding transcriptional regulator [Desemzia sp. RIT 804]MBM6615180.1 LacI family DNA-binding transcriptional regulator [Desemzia sp. RIT 804]
MNTKQITIKDIAKEANVSGTTVSRYLNGKFEYMSTETRTTIEKVISDLDFRPSNIARTLKSNKSKVIGAVIADIENPFSTQIIKGLTDKANEIGYSLMISISNNSIDKEKEGVERFLDNRVDGLIVNTVGLNEHFLQETKNKVPIVFIDRGVVGFQGDTISSNNYELGQQMMNHLFEKNFQSIGFFTENIENNTVREDRYRAFKDAAEKKKQTIAKTYIVDITNKNNISQQLERFCETPAPRVIFAGNGVVLQMILTIMKEKNYKIGEDFSICGYDNWIWASFVGKDGITAIDQDSYALGTETVTLLHKRINKSIETEKPSNIKIKGKLIIRGSTN